VSHDRIDAPSVSTGPGFFTPQPVTTMLDTSTNMQGFAKN
jgi:hypothetical protein